MLVILIHLLLPSIQPQPFIYSAVQQTFTPSIHHIRWLHDEISIEKCSIIERRAGEELWKTLKCRRRMWKERNEKEWWWKNEEKNNIHTKVLQFKNVWVKNSSHFPFLWMLHSLNLDLLRVHIKWTFSPFEFELCFPIRKRKPRTLRTNTTKMWNKKIYVVHLLIRK